MALFYSADSTSLSLFLVLIIGIFFAITYSVYKLNYKFQIFLACFVTYLFLFRMVVKSGLPLTKTMPTVPLLFLGSLIVSIIFALSPYGKKLSQHYPLAVLIGFQAFRLPLELILHHWAQSGTVPYAMTWTGQNWDVVSGVVSLVAIPFVNKIKALAWAVQVIGFVLLLNVIRVVVMASPLPFGWNLGEPLVLIGYLPYALIVPLCVGAALAAHIITFRSLIKK